MNTFIEARQNELSVIVLMAIREFRILLSKLKTYILDWQLFSLCAEYSDVSTKKIVIKLRTGN